MRAGRRHLRAPNTHTLHVTSDFHVITPLHPSAPPVPAERSPFNAAMAQQLISKKRKVRGRGSVRARWVVAGGGATLDGWMPRAHGASLDGWIERWTSCDRGWASILSRPPSSSAPHPDPHPPSSSLRTLPSSCLVPSHPSVRRPVPDLTRRRMPSHACSSLRTVCSTPS